MNYKRITVASLPQTLNSSEVWWWSPETVGVLDADRDGDLYIFVGMSGKIWNPLLSTDPKPYFIENISSSKFTYSSILEF
jgi:hypothetical protein